MEIYSQNIAVFAKFCQKLEGIHCYMINTENTLAFCERMEYFKRYYQFLCGEILFTLHSPKRTRQKEQVTGSRCFSKRHSLGPQLKSKYQASTLTLTPMVPVHLRKPPLPNDEDKWMA